MPYLTRIVLPNIYPISPLQWEILRWCEQALQGEYTVSWYFPPPSATVEAILELRTAAPEDHALVQLTWQ